MKQLVSQWIVAVGWTLLGVGWGGIAGSLPAQEVITFHEWKGFAPGAWKRVRVQRETFDEKGGRVSNTVAETTTTLLQVDDHGVTLRAEVSVAIAGRRFSPQPQEIWYGFQGQTKGQTVETKQLGAETFELNGHKVPVQVCQVVLRDGKLERTNRVHCIEDFPYVVRKESVLLDLSGEQPKELDRLTSELIATQMPYTHGEQIISVAVTRTVVMRPDGKTVTVELHNPDVPGHVVAHWSTKWDATGRVVERSVLELVDYDSGSSLDPARTAPIRRPLLHRPRPFRP